MIKGKAFDKYSTRGDFHWREFKSRDIRVYNAYHAARYEWILRMAGDVQGKRVLDAGCGDGLFTYILASKGARVTGVDTDPKGLELAREHIENEKGEESSLTHSPKVPSPHSRFLMSLLILL